MLVPFAKPQHVGIVACSSEGAALCYQTLCLQGHELFGRYGHPEISMHAPSFARYVDLIERDDWDGVGGLMLDSAQKLARAGADFLICPDNTIHRALPSIEGRLPLPWLHIADAVADRAVELGLRRVGLTGTRWLVESAVYPEKLSARHIDFVRPTAEVRVEINRIIMDELVNGIFQDASRAYVLGAIERLGNDGCDAVVLGCTELPLIVEARDCAVPVLDSTRLLARAALRRAL
jgi:aspartate racemase